MREGQAKTLRDCLCKCGVLGEEGRAKCGTGSWQILPSGSTCSLFSVFSMSSLQENKMGNRLEAGQERIKTLGAGLERWPS